MIGKNNPFNIRKSSYWKGLIGWTQGFCDFTERKYGIRAALYLLLITYRRNDCDTIEKIINRFAPPSENNTANYIDYVADKSRIPCSFKLITKEQYFLVMNAMSIMEGNPVTINELVTTYFEFIKDLRFDNYEKV